MHCVVNTRLLLRDRLDGIGWFSHEVLSRLTARMSDWKFTFLFDRPFDERFIYHDNVRAKTLFPPTRHPLLYRWYFEVVIPQQLHALKADVFFSPDGFLTTRSGIPQVPVIHDLNFEHRPMDLPPAYRTYYRRYFPKFASIAKHIVTVSEFSRRDIATSYGIAEEKISVAYNGYNECYRALTAEEKLRARSHYAGGNSYFIFIGNFSYRKNVHGIIRAFDLYRAEGGRAHLLLVGNSLWRYDEMNNALDASPNRNAIHLAGHLAIDALVHALGGATAMVFPSYFEGFGIPVLEAFAAGVPVVTSDCASLPEVCGRSALFAGPDDHHVIASHLNLIESNEDQRNKLITGGRERLTNFSWDKTANKVQEVLFSL